MRWRWLILFSIFFSLALWSDDGRAETTSSVSGRIVKVLPLLMDTNGAVATSPSLFDRDAYQAFLREHHTNEVSGIRFDVCWTARHARGRTLTVRVELRGIGAHGLPTEATLEQTVRPGMFRHWKSLTLAGGDYKKLGTLSAWRATLWNGKQKLGEQRSFLWSL